MSYNKFQADTVIEINGAGYWPQGYSGGRLAFVHQVSGEHFRCEQSDGSLALPTDEQFDSLLVCGDVKIRSLKSACPVRRINDEAEWTQQQAKELDGLAERRLVLCRLLDDAAVLNGDDAIRRFLKANWTTELAAKYGRHDPPRTIRNWRANRGRPGDRHPRHMVGLNRSRIDEIRADTPYQQLLWKCVLEGRKDGHSVSVVYARYALHIRLINEGRHPLISAPETPIRLCSEQTVRRYFNRLESNLTLPSVIEKQANEQDWLGAGKPLTADYAMQRVIIDHTWLDVHVVCPTLEMVLGRPWLTLAIDVKSRAIVGHLITFHSPSVWTVGEILRRIILPKRPPRMMADRYPILAKLRGKPTEIILDNAAEFRSHMMEAAARHAGFSVRFCPVKQPRYRAMCERAIGTINRQICEAVPGRTLTIHDARRLGYEAEDHAVIMVDELEAIGNQVISDYNVAPHDGLMDRQPALVFEKDLNRHGINNFTDFESFRRDTLDILQGVRLTPSGVRAFSGLRFHNVQTVPELLNDLVPLEARRNRRDDATVTVDIRYDPMDISKIYVWNRKTRKYAELQCSDETYADGLPLSLHNKIREAAKAEGANFNTKEERLAARGRMVEAIRSISPGEAAASRKRVAELLEIPRIRQITGNIVELANIEPEAISLGEFISNDRAALASIDHEILSARPTPAAKQKSRNLRRKSMDAYEAQRSLDVPERRRRPVTNKGGYQ